MTVTLRDYPAPYLSMLAICSDLDETVDCATYVEISRFLNTTAVTAYGPGAGLEVGNTLYFEMESGHFSYWATDESGRVRLRALMQSGHIDCFHSFGDVADRAGAARALDELRDHGCSLKVWVDHGTAPTNFGDDIMQGEGDVPGSAAYHADLTIAFGVRYVWCGRVTSVIGQNVPTTYAGIVNRRRPWRSAETVAKTFVKHQLASVGYRKYSIHADNRLMVKRRLRSGHEVLEFVRCNPHWGGVSSGDTGEGLGEVLTDAMLRTLVEKRGCTILYTHLGKGLVATRPLGAATVEGVHRLASYQRDGRILVTTTAKLLQYHRVRDDAEWRVKEDPDGRIEIEVTNLSGEVPDGLTFYVDDERRTNVCVNGTATEVERHPADYSGRPSVSIPWRRLTFPL